ncbi:hypothetical protein CIPAW_09G183800, partial [Carya illinoinensis]
MQLKEDLTLIQRGSRTVSKFLHAVKKVTATASLPATPLCPVVSSPSPVPSVCIVPSDGLPVTTSAPAATTTVNPAPPLGMASSAHASNSSSSETPLPIAPAPPTRTHPMVTRA